MPDQVASLLPSGAGRFQDFIWPDPLQMLGAGIGASFRSRVGGGAEMPGTLVGFGAAYPSSVLVFSGEPVQVIPSDGAGGSQRIFYPGFPVYLRTSRTPIDGTTDDCAVYRFVIVMSAAHDTTGNGEQGFQLTQWNNGAACRLVEDNVPGVSIDLPLHTNGLTIRANGPNGVQSQNFVLSVPFMSVLDARFFSATATADAFWTLRLNGVVVPLSAVMSNWGAPGTNLPPAGITAGSVGFVPSLVSSANTAAGLLGVQSVQLIAAPTELMTL